MSERAAASKAVCETLLESYSAEECINILMTALGTMIEVHGQHVKARCIQLHVLADQIQVDHAIKGLD